MEKRKSEHNSKVRVEFNDRICCGVALFRDTAVSVGDQTGPESNRNNYISKTNRATLTALLLLQITPPSKHGDMSGPI